MNYKEVFYENYVKSHTQALYGKDTIERITTRFPVWRYYFSDILPQRKDASILDIGCGNGSFVYFLRQIGFENVSGVDISEQQIKEGEQIGIIGLSVADFQIYLKGKPNTYDCIIARDVFEHFTKQEIFEIFSIVNRALKYGGSIILQSPNGEGLHYTSIFFGDFTHEIAFTRSSLTQLFNNTNFVSSDFKPTGPVPKGVISVIRWILWELIVLKCKFLKMVETGSWGGVFTQNIIAKGIKNDKF